MERTNRPGATTPSGRPLHADDPIAAWDEAAARINAHTTAMGGTPDADLTGEALREQTRLADSIIEEILAEEAVEAQAPTITRLTTEVMPSGVRRSTYRIVGAPIDPAWKVRAGHEPWCEITTWDVGEYRSLGAFGGELWPAAWRMIERIGMRAISVFTKHARAWLDAADACADGAA